MSGLTVSEKSPSLSSTSWADLSEGSPKPHVWYILKLYDDLARVLLLWKELLGTIRLEDVGCPCHDQHLKGLWFQRQTSPSDNYSFLAFDSWHHFLHHYKHWPFFAATPFEFIWPGYLSAFPPRAHQIHATRRLPYIIPAILSATLILPPTTTQQRLLAILTAYARYPSSFSQTSDVSATILKLFC